MNKKECKACYGRGYTGTIVAMKGYEPGIKTTCPKCDGTGIKGGKAEPTRKTKDTVFPLPILVEDKDRVTGEKSAEPVEVK